VRVRITPEFPRLVIADCGMLWGPSGKRINPFVRDTDPYLQFNLCLPDKRSRRCRVHVAVCTAFHGPRCQQRPIVRHLDGNLFNNQADNLRWGTQEENEADKVLHGTAPRGENHGSAKLTEAQVKEIRSVPLHRGVVKELASLYGVSATTISNVRSGRNWGHLA
jgi:hypothetical protein